MKREEFEKLITEKLASGCDDGRTRVTVDDIHCAECGSLMTTGQPCSVCRAVANKKAALACNPQVASVARGMCAAYWRGKFEAEKAHPNQIERLVEGYAENNWPDWIAAAKSAVSRFGQR